MLIQKNALISAQNYQIQNFHHNLKNLAKKMPILSPFPQKWTSKLKKKRVRFPQIPRALSNATSIFSCISYLFNENIVPNQNNNLWKVPNMKMPNAQYQKKKASTRLFSMFWMWTVRHKLRREGQPEVDWCTCIHDVRSTYVWMWCTSYAGASVCSRAFVLVCSLSCHCGHQVFLQGGRESQRETRTGAPRPDREAAERWERSDRHVGEGELECAAILLAAGPLSTTHVHWLHTTHTGEPKQQTLSKEGGK